MKKLKIAVLLLTIVAFVTACSCSRKEYTVEFDSNGGTKVQSQSVVKGGKVTKPDDPTKEGYTFGSWQLDGETYDFDSEVREDLVLVAKWNKKENTNEGNSSNETPVANVCTKTCDQGYGVDYSSCTCYKLTVTAVNVNATSKDVEIDETYQITASVSPSGVLNKKLTYSSSDTSVATVSESGLVKGIKPGKAVITVKSEDSGKIATVTIRVLDVYTFTTEAVDSSNISYKVTLYKNGTKLTEAEAKAVNAVYNKDGKYLGRYSDEVKTIVVDKEQVSSVGTIILDETTYKVKPRVIG